MRNRSSVRNLLLGLVNVVVLLGATLIIQSQAEEDLAPSYASFDLADPSELELLGIGTSTGSKPRGSSSGAATVTPSAAGRDTSAQIVASTGTSESAVPFDTSTLFETALPFEQPAPRAPSLLPVASEASPKAGISAGNSLSLSGSLSGNGGSSSRSTSTGGYAGGGGGGFSSGGGGLGSPQGSLTADSNTRASTLSRSDDSSNGGAPLLPTQSQANLPFGGPAFPLTQVPGFAAGGPVATVTLLSTPGAGSTTAVSQLQPVQVPEPSTLLLLGGGLALAACRNRRKLTR